MKIKIKWNNFRNVLLFVYLDLLSFSMTLPNANKDLLICAPSLNLAPSAPEYDTRSEPARSTKFKVETLTAESTDMRGLMLLILRSVSSSVLSRLSITTRKIACDRLLVSLAPVAPKLRFSRRSFHQKKMEIRKRYLLSPKEKIPNNCSADKTISSLTFPTYTPFCTKISQWLNFLKEILHQYLHEFWAFWN